jgi:AGZA family xanthine/uracil permease-like MFS transporter
MTKYRWATWGDINAFFGLMLDNTAVLVLLVSTLAVGPVHFTPQFVLERMIPGTALGVLLGDLAYTVMAFRLARRTGKSDVTAMPLGLDTPSTFAVGFLVLIPALQHWLDEHPGDHETGMVYAWHVGALVLVLIGILKTLLAPLGNAVRRWVPRAGLLGSLASVALALIAFLPLLNDVAAVPLVGLLSLAVILIALVARRPLPGKLPGALAAVVLGVAAYLLLEALQRAWGLPLVPPNEAVMTGGASVAMPATVWKWDWWEGVLGMALAQLPVMLPFGLANIVGGIDCTESAAAVGDEYDTRTILLAEGLTSVAAGLAGGVIQNTPYIGHPAYKAMGGRAAYTLATALFIGAAGFFGWFTHLFEWLPRPAMFPILIFIGLEITAQSFHATPREHYPAVAFAVLPALAYLITIPIGMALGGRDPIPEAASMMQTLRCLANGFIVTSLLWAAALAAIIDGRTLRSAGYLLIAAACSLFGIMHSPFVNPRIDLPQTVIADLKGAAQFQTPYHWAAAYTLMAALVAGIGLMSPAKQAKAGEEVTPAGGQDRDACPAPAAPIVGGPSAQ